MAKPTLDAVYPIVYLDCIVLKVRQDSCVINKSVLLALGINMEGKKERLGMWLAKKGGVAGNPVCIPEMDDAVEGLAYGNEPLYYRVR